MSGCAHCDAGAIRVKHLYANTCFHPVKRYGMDGDALLVMCLKGVDDEVLRSCWRGMEKPDERVVA